MNECLYCYDQATEGGVLRDEHRAMCAGWVQCGLVAEEDA